MSFRVGQKWVSNAEPELGMGRITAIDSRLVSVSFDLSEETRTYARQQAPLTRVRFAPGDRIRAVGDLDFLVESVSESDQIIVYHATYNGTPTAVMETDLSPDIRFSKPENRLFTHQFDDNRWFDLRYYSLLHRAKVAESSCRGLYGPRVSLIPHQLYIANQVAERFAPRVLLADEVGLGKTIEAGMIIHKQLLTGKASRVLVLVPPALTFQWFVELIRRFNMQFVILDEERCQQIESDNQEEAETGDGTRFNPFEAQQLMLSNLELFQDNPLRLQQALESEIDLMVIDEAHHLEWYPNSASPAYQIASLLSEKIESLLLLTATPEQLGKEGHFARLRLLDPARFHSLEAFIAEENSYEPVAEVAGRLLSNEHAELQEIESFLKTKPGEHSKDELLDMLLDRHGTGRILFRNVRAAISGFPRREPIAYPLALPVQYRESDNPFFPESQYSDQNDAGWTRFDPRVSWLIELVKSLSGDKVLLICANIDTAIQLEAFLAKNTAIRTTVFHEGMDLVARDRSATYFSEMEKGAQLMVCSEIGSEGRNFQFSHHLVLFDLPLSPDLIEQRIGRLDRIGQTRDVTIHIPYFQNSLQESVFRLYHEGLELFASPNAVAQTVLEEILEEFDSAPLDELIEKTRQLNTLHTDAINKGRDRLLELHSNNPQEAAVIKNNILHMDQDPGLSHYLEKNFDAWGLESEYLGNDVFHLKPTEAMMRHASISVETQGRFHYPEIPEEGMMYTYNRAVALAREDVLFLTWESPMVEQALDIVISDFTGNSAVIVVKHPQLKPGTLLIEGLHVVEAISPAKWNLPHYLPPSVLRTIVNSDGKDLGDQRPFESYTSYLQEYPAETLYKIIDSQADLLKSLIRKLQSLAQIKLEEIKKEAHATMSTHLDSEIYRIKALQKVNPNIRPDEVHLLEESKANIEQAIKTATVRLDAIRVIVAS